MSKRGENIEREKCQMEGKGIRERGKMSETGGKKSMGLGNMSERGGSMDKNNVKKGKKIDRESS